MRKLLVIIPITLVLLEVIIRLTGIFQTYSEKNYGHFINPFEQVHESHYWKWAPLQEVMINNAEFTYIYHTNSIGLVDKELDTANASSTLVFVGDSFTHGQGAPQDSSMPRLFENLLRERQPTPVLNAGIPSGDPFFYARMVEDLLVPVGYSHYVLVLNNSDIYDFIWRGGSERFRSDGTSIFRESPSYMKAYEKMHLFRAFVHVVLRFDHSYISKRRGRSLKKESVEKYSEELLRLNGLLAEQNASLMILIHPLAQQFSSGNESDLRDYEYLEQLYTKLDDDGLRIINLQSAFGQIVSEENYLQYSWKLDKHFNSAGYSLFAQLALNEIQKEYPEFLLSAIKLDGSAQTEAEDSSLTRASQN